MNRINHESNALAPSLKGLRGKRILVTGANGFIGRQVVALAWEIGAEVHSFGRSAVREFPAVHWKGDICDPAAVRLALEGSRPQFIVHLAAVGVSSGSPSFAELLRVNRDGLRVLLEAVRANETSRSVVCAGSGYEYVSMDRPLSERDTVCGVNDYGKSKVEAMEVAAAFAPFVPVRWVRLFNIYGPGEAAARLAPYIIDRARRRTAAELTPGEQVRDFTHVADVAYALLCAAVRPAAGPELSILNFGSGRSVTLRDFAETLALALTRRGLTPDLRFGARPYRPEEPMNYVPELREWLQTFGYLPARRLDQGLDQLVDQALNSAQSNP